MQEKILKRVQVNMPFHSLYRQYLPMVVEKSINPEICFSHDDIENFMVQDYVRVAEVLLDHGLTVTFHAPFMDLRPGAVDQKIRQASIERLMQVFDIAPFFRPSCIVCHPSFDDRYYVSTEEAWVENSLDTWGKFITLAEEMDTTIALENVYEKTPHQLCRLFRGLDAANLISVSMPDILTPFQTAASSSGWKNSVPSWGNFTCTTTGASPMSICPSATGTSPSPGFSRRSKR